MATAELKYWCERRKIRMISNVACDLRRARVQRVHWLHPECADCPGATLLDSPRPVTVADPQPIQKNTEPAPTASKAADSGPNPPQGPKRAATSTKRDGAGSSPSEAAMNRSHPICKMPGCDEPAKRNVKGQSMGYCPAHYVAAIKHGRAHVQARPPPKIRGEAVPPRKESRLSQSGATLGGMVQKQIERLESGILGREARESLVDDLVNCIKGLGEKGRIPGWEISG
jgi:hypothetical protein